MLPGLLRQSRPVANELSPSLPGREEERLWIGDDRIGSATVQGIDETLEVYRYAESEASLGDVLPNRMLVQVSDQGLEGGDRGEECFLRGSLGSWGGLQDRLRLGCGLSDRLCGAEAADAGGWIEATLEEWDVSVEVKGAARRFVGHRDTEVRGVSESATLAGRIRPSMVSVGPSMVSVGTQDREVRREEASLPEDDLDLEKGHIYRTLVLIGRGRSLCVAASTERTGSIQWFGFFGDDRKPMGAKRQDTCWAVRAEELMAVEIVAQIVARLNHL